VEFEVGRDGARLDDIRGDLASVFSVDATSDAPSLLSAPQSTLPLLLLSSASSVPLAMLFPSNIPRCSSCLCDFGTLVRRACLSDQIESAIDLAHVAVVLRKIA